MTLADLHSQKGIYKPKFCVSLLFSTEYKVKYQVVKLQIQGDESVFDPVVQSAVLQQVSHYISFTNKLHFLIL